MSLPLFDNVSHSRPKSHTAERLERLLAPQHGQLKPISLRTLHAVTSLSESTIRDAIAELMILHNVPIGAHATDPPSYFMAETIEDIEIACKPYRRQILTQLRRLRALEGRGAVRQWLARQSEEFDS